jgi:hypothetical protein
METRVERVETLARHNNNETVTLFPDSGTITAFASSPARCVAIPWSLIHDSGRSFSVVGVHPPRCRGRTPWGAETSSCGWSEFVFVDEAAEEVASVHAGQRR